MFTFTDKVEFENSKLHAHYISNRSWFLDIGQSVYQDASLGGSIPHQLIDLDELSRGIMTKLSGTKKWGRILKNIDPWMLDADRKKNLSNVSKYMVFVPSEAMSVFRVAP